jgi:hypothetical protein
MTAAYLPSVITGLLVTLAALRSVRRPFWATVGIYFPFFAIVQLVPIVAAAGWRRGAIAAPLLLALFVGCVALGRAGLRWLEHRRARSL